MANVLMATKQAATSSMGVITTTAQTLESTVSAAGKYISTLEAHADMYQRRTIRTMALDDEGAFERAKQQKAMDDASFYEQLDKQLEGNPRLEQHYKAAIERYNKVEIPENTYAIAAE